VLVDPLVNDVATLATANAQVEAVTRAGAEIPGRRAIPYVFVAPRRPDAIGRIATEVYREIYAPPKGLLRSADLAVLGRLVAGDRDPAHGELLSYLFFAPEFTGRLLELGRRDAERWLEARHDDGIWRVGSPPPA
jgi:NTE family protein